MPSISLTGTEKSITSQVMSRLEYVSPIFQLSFSQTVSSQFRDAMASPLAVNCDLLKISADGPQNVTGERRKKGKTHGGNWGFSLHSQRCSIFTSPLALSNVKRLDVASWPSRYSHSYSISP